VVINIINNIIEIDTTNCILRKYQASQFGFYGYLNKDDLFYLNSNNLEIDILKIINYLNNEEISFELTSNSELFINDIVEKKNNQVKLFALARNIKNGAIDKDTYTDFKQFLSTLPRKLKTHQIKAAFHLYSLKCGANFSVPGSGKTSVVISVYEKLRIEGRCNVMFVVGPPSCFQPWQNEFKETLGRNIETVILSGGDKDLRKSEYYKNNDSILELYLSTYQTLMNDHRDVIKLLGQKGVNVFFVIDEAHYMKQLGGSWANSLLEIARFTRFRCVLTGTPIPKSYTDVFNLFDFLWYDSQPLDDNDKINISYCEKNKKDKEVKALLDEKIGPLFYRVRKKDLGLKPAVFHEPILIKMHSNEKRIYELIKSKIHELSKDDFINNEEILSKLWKGRMMRLRQAASYPKMLLRSIENYDENLLYGNSELIEIIKNYDSIERTGKLEFLSKKVIELNKNKQKVLIWSNFIGTLELIKSNFAELNLKCELIYGKTPVKSKSFEDINDEMTRDEIRDVFVDPNSGLDILIANPAACAESISLHKTCFNAIYFDLSYNCAQYLQSLDRIHRVGGSENNTANYYFLQYENSIDQDIKSNLEIKAEKMYSIVEQDYEIYNLDMFEDADEDDIAAYKRLFKV
jgi:SNF2 family DNA or RNA helicase